jgi:catechol 2,3-dioxygenase-like lactoylglutathione lyase family enzyme
MRTTRSVESSRVTRRHAEMQPAVGRARHGTLTGGVYIYKEASLLGKPPGEVNYGREFALQLASVQADRLALMAFGPTRSALPGRTRMLSEHPLFPILLSRDLDASRTFYHSTLGLEVLREDPGDRIVFRSGGGTQLVVTLSTTGTADSQTQMAWRVPDIHEAVADLRARGVRIEEYAAPDPVTVDGIADMGHSWAAWFIDPSQNVLAVVQPKG